MSDRKTRPYDATRRRERAEEERNETRRKVVAAAHSLFVEKGYVATTVNDIAKAGVALQSVYKAGGSKAELLHRVADIAVGGDDEDVKVHERPGFTAVAHETDPVTKLHRFASLICDIKERMGPVDHACAEAAAVDPAAGEFVRAAHKNRYDTFAAAIRTLPEEAYRGSYDEMTTTAWALGSTEVFRLLTEVLDYDNDQVRTWLADTLVASLLTSP
jgi:AcrR family transcriptional regulator